MVFFNIRSYFFFYRRMELLGRPLSGPLQSPRSNPESGSVYLLERRLYLPGLRSSRLSRHLNGKWALKIG